MTNEELYNEDITAPKIMVTVDNDNVPYLNGTYAIFDTSFITLEQANIVKGFINISIWIFFIMKVKRRLPDIVS